MHRILSLYRSRAIATSDSLYKPGQRADWIGMLPNRMQAAAEFLLRQYDAVEPLRREIDLHCGRLRRSSWTSLYFAKPRTVRFKGAATTVIGRAQKDCPIYHHYELMLANKTKPNLAKLTIARQIAAITLSLWKKEVTYDPAKLIKSS